ncbi:MAG: hypothetical protein WCL44_15660 [bacterium]
MNQKIMLVMVSGLIGLTGSLDPARGQGWIYPEKSTEREVRNDRWRGNDDRHSYRDDRRYDNDDRGRSNSRYQANDPDAIVRRAYQDVLNRAPDPAGLRVYRSHIIDDNWSEQDVRNALRKSPEREGRTPAAADAMIRRAYQDILGRDPDAAGLATYRAKFLSEGWSERDVRSNLKNSPEYRKRSERK